MELRGQPGHPRPESQYKDLDLACRWDDIETKTKEKRKTHQKKKKSKGLERPGNSMYIYLFASLFLHPFMP